MGGSGGGGYSVPRKIKFDCENGQITTNVSSIDLAVLQKHKVADILNIIISTSNSIVLEDGNGEILGAVLHASTSELINCIKNGNEYEAEIISIQLSTCRILIKRKTS